MAEDADQVPEVERFEWLIQALKSLQEAITIYSSTETESSQCKVGDALSKFTIAYIYEHHADDMSKTSKKWADTQGKDAELYNNTMLGPDSKEYLRNGLRFYDEAYEQFNEEGHLTGSFVSKTSYTRLVNQIDEDDQDDDDLETMSKLQQSVFNKRTELGIDITSEESDEAMQLMATVIFEKDNNDRLVKDYQEIQRHKSLPYVKLSQQKGM